MAIQSLTYKLFPECHVHVLLGLQALPMLFSYLEHLGYTGKGKGKHEKVVRTKEVVLGRQHVFPTVMQITTAVV